MKDLVIVGAGPFAQIAAEYFEEFDQRRTRAFAVHPGNEETDAVLKSPIIDLSSVGEHFSPRDVEIFIAVGHRDMNRVRAEFFRQFVEEGFFLASFIHPGVKIWNSTSLGRHLFILESNVIQPYTEIGSNTVMWSGNHIGHHASIGENCFITSHVVISGNARVGNNSFLGVNASVSDGVHLGERVFLRPGTNITADLPDGSVVSAPAPRLSRFESDELFGPVRPL